MEEIYLDYNATTPVLKEVLDVMIPYFSDKFSNPSAIYSSSQAVRVDMENAREIVANFINAGFEEIIFTSSGTESNNMAIKSYLDNFTAGTIACSKIEHHSVLNTFESLKDKFEVEYIDVDKNCKINIDSLVRILEKKPIIVSIMFVNNETGTIQNIKEISEIVHFYNSIIHVDAVQAAGKIDIDVKDLDVDLLTISAHKFYGPKGISILYIKKGLKFNSWLHGGKQEKELRASTENIPAIIGFAKACEIAKKDLKLNNKNQIELIEYLKEELNENIFDFIINGDETFKISNTLNISIRGVNYNDLLMALDINNISLSSASACNAGLSETSHVLKACGINEDYINGTLRFSIGKYTTKIDITKTVKVLKKIIKKQRG